MANALSPALLAQMFSQESGDPFLTLLTLSHPDFDDDIRLVNNTENVTSRSKVYTAFPFIITLPADNGESSKSVSLEFDNVSRELIGHFRTVDRDIQVKIEMILFSLPNEVQIFLNDLVIQSISYNRYKISASLSLDNFLNTSLTSEKYNPQNFPGLFG